jgi:hypothetical protein
MAVAFEAYLALHRGDGESVTAFFPTQFTCFIELMNKHLI